MHHLLRRITLPAVALSAIALPTLGTAYAADDPTDPASPVIGGSVAAGDTPPAGLLCNGVAPTLWATADNQTITATNPLGDVIAANGFHGLTLKGGDGNDTICGAADAPGAASNTTLDGGAGNDTLVSTGGRDRLIGGAGDDKLVGTINNDVVYSADGYAAGGTGITINLSAGTVTGAQSGNDTLVGLNQARFFGTDAADVFLGDDAANWFDGGAGADDIHGYGGDDWFHAVNPKSIAGNDGNDTITVGFGGTVSGGKGDDIIAADPNNEISGASADAGTAVTGYNLQGQSGDDTFKINTLKTDATTWSTDPALHWNGTISGGSGKDQISYAWLGTNAGLRSSSAAGVAHWALGSLTFSTTEKIVGTPGDDVLKGGSGDDILYGGDGNDTLRGKKGDDNLHGNQGDDLIFGGAGKDLANGGKGSDTCKSAETAKSCEFR
jgi:Ca2+-binding RTX toxin-like protein